MEKHREDRIEPEVEVGHEPEQLSSSSRHPGGARRSSMKKWGLAPVFLIGLVILALGLWIFLPPGILSVKEPEESPEVKALKEEVQKLRSEISPLKNDLQALQSEQKALQERLAALKDDLTGLAKKTETQGEKKASPKAIVYKIQKGDTLRSIARKFKVRPEDIRHWNRLPSKRIPKPGKTITVYPQTDS
ncbi:MAG: LysM peptidoglycan-binding domain-containing protein [Pseudomonadota bacterium]